MTLSRSQSTQHAQLLSFKTSERGDVCPMGGSNVIDSLDIFVGNTSTRVNQPLGPDSGHDTRREDGRSTQHRLWGGQFPPKSCSRSQRLRDILSLLPPFQKQNTDVVCKLLPDECYASHTHVDPPPPAPPTFLTRGASSANHRS